MPLLVLMIPIAILTVLVTVILAVIAIFQKDSDKKFTGPDIIFAALHFLALTGVALAVMQVGFAAIEKWIPDLLVDQGYRTRSLAEYTRFALAVLVVGTPIYAVVAWKGAQAAKKSVSWTKKFMAAVVLLTVGGVLLGSVVTLVYSFLSGELGMRLFAQLVFLSTIAFGVGAYYQVFVREHVKHVIGATKLFIGITLCVTIGAFVVGIMVSGGPAQVRAERFDEQRLQDLSSIQWRVQSYFNERTTPPQTLSELEDPLVGYAVPRDPRTEKSYGYTVRSFQQTERNPEGDVVEPAELEFELCATFETEREVRREKELPQPEAPVVDSAIGGRALPNYYDDSPFWDHGAERTCFIRTVRENVPNMR